MLSERKVVTRQEFVDKLEISWATLKRDLAYLKDRFNAPILHDRQSGGYRFNSPNVGPKYELPGLWFNADETSWQKWASMYASRQKAVATTHSTYH
jgi:predicted DNA-binding transcriptional regulator YafY